MSGLKKREAKWEEKQESRAVVESEALLRAVTGRSPPFD
jgi:hypothetical protein